MHALGQGFAVLEFTLPELKAAPAQQWVQYFNHYITAACLK